MFTAADIVPKIWWNRHIDFIFTSRPSGLNGKNMFRACFSKTWPSLHSVLYGKLSFSILFDGQFYLVPENHFQSWKTVPARCQNLLNIFGILASDENAVEMCLVRFSFPRQTSRYIFNKWEMKQCETMTNVVSEKKKAAIKMSLSEPELMPRWLSSSLVVSSRSKTLSGCLGGPETWIGTRWCSDRFYL